MLVLSRRRDSKIQIGADAKITITVLAIHKGHVKLGIDAPNEISILRGELSLPAGRSRRQPSLP